MKKMIYKTVVAGMLGIVVGIGGLTACSGMNDTNVAVKMKVDGNSVSEDMYRYFFNFSRTTLDQGDAEYWLKDGKEDEEKLETLKKDTENHVRKFYAVLKLANDNNITLTSEDQENVTQQLEMQKEQAGGEEQFTNSLAEHALTLNTYKQIYIEQAILLNKLVLALYEDQLSNEIHAEEFIRAKHILIKANKEDEDFKEKKKTAEEILKKAKAGDDFDELIKQYGMDPGMESNPDGYYFTDNEMVTEFYEAAKALKDNEISKAVESVYGFHIIKRLPFTKEELVKVLKSQDKLTQFAGEEIKTQFNDKLKELSESLTVEYGPQYKNLTYKSFPLPSSEEENNSSTASAE